MYLIFLATFDILCKPLLETESRREIPERDGGQAPQSGVELSWGRGCRESIVLMTHWCWKKS